MRLIIGAHGIVVLPLLVRRWITFCFVVGFVKWRERCSCFYCYWPGYSWRQREVSFIVQLLHCILHRGFFYAGQFSRVVVVKLIGGPYQIHYGRTAPLLCTVFTIGGLPQVEIEWESTASGVDVATASSEIREDTYLLSSLPIQGEIDTNFCGTYSCAASLSNTLRDTQTFGIG